MNAQPGGFYHPSVIIGDARRHGIPVLRPDLTTSAYDCTIERVADGRLAVRLGLRYVRGLADAIGQALVAARDRGEPYRDLADLCRRGRAFLTPEAITALIAAGACDGWGMPRRQLLWALPATWRGATGLPLPVRAVPLPPETLGDRIAGEAWATGLPLTTHVLATQRVALTQAGVHPIAALTSVPVGATITIAGLPIVAQAPPTAHGVLFLSLEDETGLANAILAPSIARSQRAALFAAPILRATGRVQRRGETVNLLVQTITPWATTTNNETASGDRVQSV
jgi:error-prone DNA polymerase